MVMVCLQAHGGQHSAGIAWSPALYSLLDRSLQEVKPSPFMHSRIVGLLVPLLVLAFGAWIITEYDYLSFGYGLFTIFMYRLTAIRHGCFNKRSSEKEPLELQLGMASSLAFRRSYPVASTLGPSQEECKTKTAAGEEYPTSVKAERSVYNFGYMTCSYQQGVPRGHWEKSTQDHCQPAKYFPWQ